MANLNLTDLMGDMNKTYGNWTVEFGPEDKPRSCDFVFVLRADKETRARFWDCAFILGRLVRGQASEEELAEYAKEADDPHEFMLLKTVEVFRELAVSKVDFKALEKAVGGDFMVWDRILQSYFDNYGLTPGEQSPSQTS